MLLHPWGFPGKSTGVGCHRLLHLQRYWLGFTEKQKPYIYRGRDCPLFPKALLIFLEVIETQILAGYVAS